MRYREATHYQDAALQVAAAFPALLNRYATVEAVNEALDAASASYAMITVQAPNHHNAPYRLNLGMAIHGDDNATLTERVYLLEPSDLKIVGAGEGKRGILLRQIAEFTWTNGTTSIPSDLGGETDFTDAKAVTSNLTPDRVEAIGQNPIGVISDDPAGAFIYDAGNPVAFLRLAIRDDTGESTSFRFMGSLWR